MSTSPLNSCPKDKPFLCDENTVAYGLCRKNKADCHKREAGYPDIGWDDKTHTNKYLDICDTSTKQHILHNHNPNNMIHSTILRIISWNVWKLETNKEYKKEYFFLSDLMILRAKRFAQYIEEYDPHIILLQEANNNMVECIRMHIPHDIYQYYGSGDLYLITKYKPHDIYYHSFDNSLSECQFIIFENLLITNLYIRSPDNPYPRASHNMHQIRCMNETLSKILLLGDEYMPRFNIICGDFGTDINERTLSLQKIKQMNAIDCWTVYHPREKGYTEDIDVNQMNRNIGLDAHNSRMCGIFLKGIPKILNVMALTSCELVGCEGFIMDHKSFQQMIDIYGEPSDKTDEYLYFVSNHFGVYTEFTIDTDYALI